MFRDYINLKEELCSILLIRLQQIHFKAKVGSRHKVPSSCVVLIFPVYRPGQTHTRVYSCESPPLPGLWDRWVPPPPLRNVKQAAQSAISSLNWWPTIRVHGTKQRYHSLLRYYVLTLSPGIVHKTMTALLYSLYPCVLIGCSVPATKRGCWGPAGSPFVAVHMCKNYNI